MLTKGAIGNLVNRYRAVLKKCNLINAFGSLAVASMLVLGGSGVAEAVITFTPTGGSATELNIPVAENTGFTGGSIVGSGNDVLNLTYNNTNVSPINSLKISNLETLSISGTSSVNSNNEYNHNALFAGPDKLLDIDIKNLIIGTEGETSTEFMTGIQAQGEIDIDLAGNLLINMAKGNAVYTQMQGTTKTPKIDIIAQDITMRASTGPVLYINNTGNATVSIESKKDLIIAATKNAASNYGPGDGSSSLSLKAAGNISLTTAKDGYYTINHSRTVENSSGVTSSMTIESTTGNITIEGPACAMRLNAQDAAVDVSTTILAENGTVTLKATSQQAGYGFGVKSNNSNLSIKAKKIDLEAVSNGFDITGDSFVELTAPDITITAPTAIKVMGGELALTGTSTINGNIDVAGCLTVNGTANLNGDSNTINELGGDGDLMVDKTSTKVAVNKVAAGSKATVKATGNLNDQLGGDAEAFKKQLSGVAATTAFGGMDEGLISGAVDASGKQAPNTVMQNTLDMATAAPLAISRIVMNDVRKRMGDLRSTKEESGVWMRWEGGKLKGDEGLTNDFNTIQVGADTKVGKNCRFGVAGAFTHGDLDHRNGEGENETFSFSAYGTWMADNGMFADVIARVGFSNTETTVKNTRIDLDNEVLSLSAEYGWRLPVCQQFFVEPQVELTYTYVSSADSKVQYATYDIDSVDSLIGRAGLVAGWNLPDDMGNVYARASVVREFLGDGKITGTAFGNSISHENDGEDTWLEYGIGANIKLTEKTYIWADVERTEGADIEEEWRGTVGVRFSF